MRIRLNVQKWSAVLALVCVTSVVPLSSIGRASLHIIGTAVGFPAGFFILHTVTAEQKFSNGNFVGILRSCTCRD